MHVAKEHWESCRQDVGAEAGMPFSMKVYGQTALIREFPGHSVLRRVWEMLAAEHALLWSGQPERAFAQNAQNLKATARALKAGGLWKGAWELTYLPELNESGVSMDGNATPAKYMKEKAAMEKLPKEALEENKKHKPDA